MDGKSIAVQTIPACCTEIVAQRWWRLSKIGRIDLYGFELHVRSLDYVSIEIAGLRIPIDAEEVCVLLPLLIGDDGHRTGALSRVGDHREVKNLRGQLSRVERDNCGYIIICVSGTETWNLSSACFLPGTGPAPAKPQ